MTAGSPSGCAYTLGGYGAGMSVRQKFAAFAVGLAVTFVAGYGVGGVLDPVIGDKDRAPMHEDHPREDAP